MVMNSYFEDVEGRVGLKRVWEFVQETGKKSNERVKVSSDSCSGSYTRRGLLADLERPAEIWGDIADRAGDETGEETVEDRKTTDLPAVRVRGSKTASPQEIPMILNALFYTA